MRGLSSFLVLWAGVTTLCAAQEQPVDYPHAPVPFTAVRIADEFWAPRMEVNRRVTVPYDFAKCEETGRIANFARAGGLEEGPFQGIYYDDSDVYKVIEGAAYTLALHPDPQLDAYLDELIAKIAAAQEDDGYLYTARTLGHYSPRMGAGRWSALDHSHELYNVGHLYEAAVAHYQATGKRTLLEVAIRNADLVCRVFGLAEKQLVAVPGHEEIELALVKLYRVTGDEKYLDQAKFFIDMRGRADLRKVYGEYAQDHAPVADQTAAVGHAVRGGYLYAGATDVAAITGDRAYSEAMDAIWEDIVRHKLYLIGNVGQHGHGEGYAGAYVLPNLQAYNETCAAIALGLWNHRMFLLHGDAKYIDVLERILYNGFLAGVSLSGDRFFYPNPLACDMQFKFNHGDFVRSPWFRTSCCPVNVVRFVPSIAGYVYAQRENSVYVNLYVGGEGRMTLGEHTLVLRQETQYPWEGAVRIRLGLDRPKRFTLALRIPGWAQGRPLPSDLYRYADEHTPPVTVKVNGKILHSRMEHGYAVLAQRWQDGDTVEIELPMPVHRVLSNAAVEENRGRVAFERGPLVYCAEGVDHTEDIEALYVPADAELTPEHRDGLLGGVTVLTGKANAVHRTADGNRAEDETSLTLVPYYAWCNRGANKMAVWLPRGAEGVRLPPAPTLASKSRPSASHTWQADSVEALNDQKVPAASNDHGVPRHTFWPRRGTEEWVQYDFERPTAIAGVRVYWFDDTGRGQCRVPAAWYVQQETQGEWRSIDAVYGVAKDQFNVATFPPVTTDALRMVVQLQPGYSGGLLEWRVDEAK